MRRYFTNRGKRPLAVALSAFGLLGCGDAGEADALRVFFNESREAVDAIDRSTLFSFRAALWRGDCGGGGTIVATCVLDDIGSVQDWTVEATNCVTYEGLEYSGHLEYHIVELAPEELEVSVSGEFSYLERVCSISDHFVTHGAGLDAEGPVQYCGGGVPGDAVLQYPDYQGVAVSE